MFAVLHLRRAAHLDQGAIGSEVLAAKLQWVLVRVIRRAERLLLPARSSSDAPGQGDGMHGGEVSEPLDACLVDGPLPAATRRR